MTDVHDAASFASQLVQETLSDDSTVEHRPVQGVIVLPKIGATARLARFQSSAAVSRCMICQYRMTDPSRSAVDHHPQPIPTQGQHIKPVVVDNLFDTLQFNEVIAAANGAQGWIAHVDWHADCGERLFLISGLGRIEMM